MKRTDYQSLERIGFNFKKNRCVILASDRCGNLNVIGLWGTSMNADMCLNTLEAVRTKSKTAQLRVNEKNACLGVNSLTLHAHVLS